MPLPRPVSPLRDCVGARVRRPAHCVPTSGCAARTDGAAIIVWWGLVYHAVNSTRRAGDERLRLHISCSPCSEQRIWTQKTTERSAKKIIIEFSRVFMGSTLR